MDEDAFVMEDGEGAEESSKDKLKTIREKLRACQAEKDEYLTGWQRARADLVNVRRDAEAQIAERTKTANRALIESLLSVFDSFDMAMRGKSWDAVDQTWKAGMAQIHSQLLSILKSHGAEPFETDGTAFDPAKHEPLRMEKRDDAEPHTVIETLSKGWMLHGKVLRPAKVVVSE